MISSIRRVVLEEQRAEQWSLFEYGAIVFVVSVDSLAVRYWIGMLLIYTLIHNHRLDAEYIIKRLEWGV